MTDRGVEADGGEPFDIDPRTAYPARVFDYLLGGKDNFAADRAAAHHMWDAAPGGIETARTIARAVHAFLVESVHYLADEAGIRQYLNLGNVVRMQDNVHEVAQRSVPDARVVYVVSDALVLAHAHELRTVSPAGTTTFVQSDLRDLGGVLREAAATLDLSEPVALLVSGVLHYVSGGADPYAFVDQLMGPLVPGSHLVVSHAASDLADALMLDVAKRQAELDKAVRWPIVPRSRDEVARFFDGMELVDPGIVTIDRWRTSAGPATPPPSATSEVSEGPSEVPIVLPWYAAVGRKPG